MNKNMPRKRELAAYKTRLYINGRLMKRYRVSPSLRKKCFLMCAASLTSTIN
jgi:hypothetical protein